MTVSIRFGNGNFIQTVSANEILIAGTTGYAGGELAIALSIKL